MMTVTITPATRNDLSALVDLYTGTMQPALRALNVEFARTVTAPLFAQRMLETAIEAGQVLVAHQGQRIVGYALVRDGRLEAMGVAADCRQQGIGTALVNAAKGARIEAPVAQEFFARATQGRGTLRETNRIEMAGHGFMGGAVPVYALSA